MEKVELWISIVVEITAGLITIIPLVISLVKYIKQAVREKNWAGVLQYAVNLMEVAETKFNDGASRKEWVMALSTQLAHDLNYEIDERALSAMIDSIVQVSKNINKAED